MKNYALLAIAAVGTLAACSKNEAAPTQPELEYSGDPVAVQFGVASPAALTKATGTVGGLAGAENVWNKQTLYVFGFNRTISDFTNAASTDPDEPNKAFIWHVEAEAPDGAESDGIDVWNYDPDGDGVQNDEAEKEPFYYDGNTVYDFYGYHIDDAYWDGVATSSTPVPVAEAERIYVPFKIDGGQDLMIAKADPAADILGTEVINPDNAYSAYAARRGVQPDLLFKHQLARFTFEIKAGSKSADDIQVEALSLYSKTTGKLVVVSKDDSQLGIPTADLEADQDWLELRQRNAATSELEPLQPVGPAAFAEGTPVDQQTTTAIGESILAIPGEASYQIQLTLGDKAGTQLTPIDPQTYTINASDLEKDDMNLGAVAFEAGKSYKITIVIYGLEEVQITASLQAWEDGGETVIDPDKPQFPEE